MCLGARAFAAAQVSQAQAAIPLTPRVLAAIGRRLCTNGQSVHAIDVVNGVIAVEEAASWDINGEKHPWMYSVDLPQPSSTITLRRSESSVLHCRYATHIRSPWEGRGPLNLATDTAALLARLEGKLAQEAGAAVGYLLPVPTEVGELEGGLDPLAALKSDLRALKGGIALVETTSAGWGDGRSASPNQDWVAKRLGPDPPASLEVLRAAAERSVLFACGVPPTLMSANTAAAREAWRQFLHATIAPVAALVAAECTEKFGFPVSLSFDALMASDIAGRARAYKSLIDAGMDKTRAERICGF